MQIITQTHQALTPIANLKINTRITKQKKWWYWLTITGTALVFSIAGKAIAADTPQFNFEDSSKIHVIKAVSQAPTKGAAEYFTGKVEVNRLFPTGDSLQMSGGYVTFEAAARTAWHTHPQGQMLIITAGKGRVQQWQGPIIEVKQGDVVWFPAGVKHWHGAAPDSSMTHLALAKMVDGKSVQWMEKVTDTQYNQ